MPTVPEGAITQFEAITALAFDALGVPFVVADATSLAQTRYVNEEIEAILQRLIDKAGDKRERADGQAVVPIRHAGAAERRTGSPAVSLVLSTGKRTP